MMMGERAPTKGRKVQALPKSEQKTLLQPPTAGAVLVSDRQLPRSLQNLAEVLGIEVFAVEVKSDA